MSQVGLRRLRGLRREEQPHRHHRGGEDRHRVWGRQWRFRVRIRTGIENQQSFIDDDYLCLEGALGLQVENISHGHSLYVPILPIWPVAKQEGNVHLDLRSIG